MVAVAYAVMDMESAKAASAGAGGEGQRAVWATVVAATTAHVSGVTVHTRPPRAAVLGSATSAQRVTGECSRSAYATASAARASGRGVIGATSRPGKRRASAGGDEATNTETVTAGAAAARGDARGRETDGCEMASGCTVGTDSACEQEGNAAHDEEGRGEASAMQRAKRARTTADWPTVTAARRVASAASDRAYDEATDAPT